jgi:SPP1 family predicted phage head-tail adaptor
MGPRRSNQHLQVRAGHELRITVFNLGPLNDRCRIESRTVTEASTLQTDIDTWSVVAVRWCALQDVLPSRSESVRENVEVSQSPTRLRMRYCTDVTNGMRVIVNRPAPKIYQIVSGPAILGNKDGVEFMLELVSTEQAA